MIRTLRNSGFGQFFLGSIVVAIILAFVFTGAPSSSVDSSNDCAVEVGKTCVTPKEFHAAFRLLTSIGLNDGAVKSLRLREQVAVGLAERELLLEEARRLGIATSEKNIDNELFEGRSRVSLPVDGAERLAVSLAMCVNGPAGCAPGTIGLRALSVKQGGSFDYDLYKRTVRVVSGRSPRQFKEMQQLEYTAERVRQLLRSQVRVSENEAYLAYSRARSKATARTVDVKSSWFARFVTAPSKDEVKAWAKAHKDLVDAAVKEKTESWKEGCAVVSEIRLDNADPTAAKTDVVKEEANKLLRSARMRVSFDELARSKSDASSASLGGRIGCLDDGYGAGSATLIEAAAELSKKGDLSPVVETIQGFHLLQLIGRVDGDNKEELLRSFLSYKLASEALAKKAAEGFAKSLIEKASSGSSLADATELMIANLLKDGPFDGEDSLALSSEDAPKSDISRAITVEQDPIVGATGDKSPAVLLFALEKDDEVAGDPIPTRDGYAVMQLKSKELITREKFAESRVEIMARLQKRKAEQALSAHLTSLMKKAGGIKMNPKFIPPEDADEDETSEEKGS